MNIQLLDVISEVSKEEREFLIGNILTPDMYLITDFGRNCGHYLVVRKFVIPFAVYQIDIENVVFLN